MRLSLIEQANIEQLRLVLTAEEIFVNAPLLCTAGSARSSLTQASIFDAL